MNRILFAGLSSGSGKTAVTCGCLRALQKKGISAAAFKCGPDYIDPMFHQRVLGIPGENLDLFKKILELEEFMDQPARKLSLGQRVRADIAAALLHDPPILFLDEPTIGLDVAVKQKVYQFLQYINKEKKTTILLTSHDLKDMEWLCRRLIILEKGEILFDDEITKIFDNYPEAETLEEIIIELFNGNTKN